jgi:molybdopterin synthase catalytic subunit
MFGFFRRLVQRYGFFKRGYASPFVGADGWERHDFFTAHKAKTERLAAIARERDALKEALKKAVKQKKARAPIYAKLRALSVEELRVETGK